MDWHCPERSCGFCGLWEDLEPEDGAVSCTSCGADLDIDPEIVAECIVPAAARWEACYYAATAPVISNGENGASGTYLRAMADIEHED